MAVKFMKKLPVILVICFCLSLLTSCTRAIVFQIFNNSESVLEIVSYDSNQSEKHYTIGKNQFERVRFSNRLTIKHGTNVWDYEVKLVPKTTTYMKSESFGPLVIKVQVENDGGVYVLHPESDVAATTANMPPQPTGYPMRPKSQ